MTEYKFKGSRIQKKFEELKENPDADCRDMAGEIALLRLLIQNEISGDGLQKPKLLADLVARLERVVYSYNKMVENLTTNFTKNEALRIASDLAEILKIHIEDKFEGWQNVLDEVIQDFAESIKPSQAS